jgi:hypothetical protein
VATKTEDFISESEAILGLVEEPEVVARTAEESEEDLPWCVVNESKGGG